MRGDLTDSVAFVEKKIAHHPAREVDFSLFGDELENSSVRLSLFSSVLKAWLVVQVKNLILLFNFPCLTPSSPLAFILTSSLKSIGYEIFNLESVSNDEGGIMIFPP